MGRERESVRVRHGRATVTGYETPKCHCGHLCPQEGGVVGLKPEVRRRFFSHSSVSRQFCRLYFFAQKELMRVCLNTGNAFRHLAGSGGIFLGIYQTEPRENIMKCRKSIIIGAACVLLCVNAWGGPGRGHGRKKSRKTGILMVVFGTSKPEALVSFRNISKVAEKRFPGMDTRWAYTSRFIRKKLAKQGTIINSPTVALSKMLDEGYTHVAVQSFHTITGREYDELKEVVAKFSTGSHSFKSISLGMPLLSSRDDMDRVIKAFLKEVPSSRKKEDAVVLMGHGSEHHPAGMTYIALDSLFKGTDPNVFLGTSQGYPTLDEVVAGCKAAGVKKAYLMPFMSVAGEHARNDMAGDGDDSWKSVLTREGITCEVVLKGIAEYDSIVNIWLDHLEIALKELDAI